MSSRVLVIKAVLCSQSFSAKSPELEPPMSGLQKGASGSSIPEACISQVRAQNPRVMTSV